MEHRSERKVVKLSKPYYKYDPPPKIYQGKGQSEQTTLPDRLPIRVYPANSLSGTQTTPSNRSVLINSAVASQSLKVSSKASVTVQMTGNPPVNYLFLQNRQAFNVTKATYRSEVPSSSIKQVIKPAFAKRPIAIRRQLSEPADSLSLSLDPPIWRTTRSVAEPPKQYSRHREEDKDKSCEHGGVNEYLFGISKKRSRSPSPVPEVPSSDVISNRQSRRKQNPIVLTDDCEKPPTTTKVILAIEAPTVPEPADEQLDGDVLNLIKWDNGIGSLPGLDGVKFRINKHNLLTLSDPSTEGMSQESTSNSQELLVCTQCGTYGMNTEFVEKRYCSWDCVDERHRRKMDVKQLKEKRRERKFQLKLEIKKLQMGYRELYQMKLHAAADAIYSEILRLRMSKEQIKLEMTDRKLHYRQYPDMSMYFEKASHKAAPLSLFKEIPLNKNPFKVGCKLEAIDPKHPALICVVTVVDIRGYRVKLRFDGYGMQHDFWVNANSCEIFQPGWCERTDHNLTPPRFWEGPFNWTIYLERRNASAAPRHAFAHPQERTVTPSGFRVGMKLEAVDKNCTRDVCTATIIDVIENRILIHIDGTSYEHDYWADNSSPYIHPAGWCAENNFPLYNKPNGKLFRWGEIIDGKASVAPARAFKTRAPHEFKVGHKVEAVDKRNPEFVRIATIIDTQPHQIRIQFDGWPLPYAYWIDEDSPDCHPFGWCHRTGHPLEKPPGREAHKSGGCETPGCSGIGHAYRCCTEHNTPFSCPYSTQNYYRDDIAPSRFQTVDEYLSVKKHSQSKGTKPRTLLSKRSKFSERKSNKQTAVVPVNSPPPSPVTPKKKERKERSREETPEQDDEVLDHFATLKQEILEKIVNFQINPRAWSIEEVENFVEEILPSKGRTFREELVDGEALLMLSKQDLIDCIGLKVGPAITLYNCIRILRTRAVECNSV